MLINFFYAGKSPNDETLLKMEAQLQLYASDSNVLVGRYLWERHREQKAMQEFPLGSVNIRVQLLREHMRVEVLNARHLKPPDPRSSKFLPMLFSEKFLFIKIVMCKIENRYVHYLARALKTT